MKNSQMMERNDEIMNGPRTNDRIRDPIYHPAADDNAVVIRPNGNRMPERTKPQPETVAEMLDQSEDLAVSAKIKFLRKVYILVTIMLMITAGFCCLSYFSKGFFQFQINNYWFFYLILLTALVLAIVFICCGSDRVSGWSQLTKFILLLCIVLCFSYVISFCTSLYAKAYGAPLVLEAAVATIILCSALTIYVFMVKVDYSILFGILIVSLLAFILFGISFAFTMSGTLHTLWATFGVILAGIILVLDTAWVANGSRGCSLDDPLLGALIIYMDIIRVFLYLLMALGGAKK